jgi:hypothetical protein
MTVDEFIERYKAVTVRKEAVDAFRARLEAAQQRTVQMHQTQLHNLISAGLIYDSGEKRSGFNGQLQPIYKLTPEGARIRPENLVFARPDVFTLPVTKN